MNKINIAIIGAGLIGKKRAQALLKIPNSSLDYVYDINKEASDKFAKEYKCKVVKNIEEILNDTNISLVIIAIRHKDAAELAPKILRRKDVLMEKPIGRNLIETKKIINAAQRHKTKLFAGFNYRFYPHIQEGLSFIKNKKLGKIISSTFTIGHAAFLGYEKTWKMDKDLCGGGVILDPGIHMVDLMQTFFGTPKNLQVFSNNIGWKNKVEDEAFLVFTFSDKTISHHHYSLNMAKNTFEIEIIGTKGMIRISGRGGNYGPMRFLFVPRWFWQPGNGEIIKEEYGQEDQSFYLELKSVFENIRTKKNVNTYTEYIKSMKVIDKIYNKQKL